MPIHDWTRVDAGLFHAFHQGWTVALQNALNAGVLPDDYFALVEQRMAGPIADVLTLEWSATAMEHASEAPGGGESGGRGVAVATAPPRTDLTVQTDAEAYCRLANRITVRHRHGRVVAVVEVASPGHKGSRAQFRAFVEKSAELIRQGVHLLVIDLFPPGRRDPRGIHKAIWDEFAEANLTRPAGRTRTLAAYEADAAPRAFVSFIGAGDPLPDMPLFLRPGFYVPTPLEATYRATWDHFPAPMRTLLDQPAGDNDRQRQPPAPPAASDPQIA